METCKVEFINQSGQKIILDFSLYENGELEYKPSFEPKVDPKTDLGLAGQLCEIFISTLHQTTDTPQPDGYERDERTNKKLES